MKSLGTFQVKPVVTLRYPNRRRYILSFALPANVQFGMEPDTISPGVSNQKYTSKRPCSVCSDLSIRYAGNYGRSALEDIYREAERGCGGCTLLQKGVESASHLWSGIERSSVTCQLFYTGTDYHLGFYMDIGSPRLNPRFGSPERSPLWFHIMLAKGQASAFIIPIICSKLSLLHHRSRYAVHSSQIHT